MRGKKKLCTLCNPFLVIILLAGFYVAYTSDVFATQAAGESPGMVTAADTTTPQHKSLSDTSEPQVGQELPESDGWSKKKQKVDDNGQNAAPQQQDQQRRAGSEPEVAQAAPEKLVRKYLYAHWSSQM